MDEFFANLNMREANLVRFLEVQLKCGFMYRPFGSDEMLWSQSAFDLLGFDPGKDVPSFTLLRSIQHPEDKLTYDQVEMRDVAADTVSRNFRIIRRDGSMRTLLQKAETLYDRDGKPEELLSLIMDITEVNCIAKRSRLLQARFDAVVQDPSFLTSLIRPDGFVTDIRRNNENDAIEEIRKGFGWRDAIHPDDREESLAIFDRAIAEKSELVREHRTITPDGNYQWRRAIWLPVFDESQELIEFIGLSQNIDREKLIGKTGDEDCFPTGAQVRGARGLLRWSVQELSEVTGVSPSAVRRIEEYDGVTEGSEDALAAIRQKLESAGVEFVFPPVGKPGVQPA